MHQSLKNNRPYIKSRLMNHKQVSIFNHIIDKTIDMYPQVDEFGDVIDEEEQ